MPILLMFTKEFTWLLKERNTFSAVPNNTTVYTIPSGHRPSGNRIAYAVCIHSSGKCGMGQVTVEGNGKVTLGALEYNEALRGGEFYIEW